MAQSNFEERIDTYEIESTNVMTGDRDQSRYLYYQLKMSMAKAKQIDIIVSFLMESGVRMLLNDMKRALDRGVKIRILTGNYLGITQPSALYLIKSELGDRVDLRLYNETSRSFHPKSYIFHYESSNEIYIGSSNISKSALTSGIEWNYRFSDTLDKKNYELLLLNEESQGLGFSNLIYLHMRLEEFYKSIDKNKVNVFFIEEPESHMHPQMQNVFIRFLKNYYVDKKLQGLITTHSNEIARMVGLDSLRVIRQTEKSKSELFDLSKFRNSIKKKKIENLDDESEFLLANFFDWFFEIGYSELIFADKVILYEGDSERLYIRKLIKLPEFSALNDSYIAFIQVGGAYAHNYLPMLRMLKMKTLIITDLDYDKKFLSMEEVKAEDSNTTNATINYCYRVAYPDRGEKYVPTIKELYDFQVKGKNILYNGLIYLAFQDENSTARTLEEAMLKKILGFDVFHMIKRSEWKKIRKDKKLTFSIPDDKEGEKDSEYSIRKIVEATANNKTDFMYSVILSENESNMLPDYIKKGLLWLMK